MAGHYRKYFCNKKILFFTDIPPQDKTAIHIWVGDAKASHEETLMYILKKYFNKQLPPLSKTPEGKPYFPDFPLHFNLSDTGGYLAIAFSWQSPVGIDIEQIRPVDEMLSLIANYFSPKEQAYVKAQDSLIRFWEIWNRKEAVCKALGVGLQNDLPFWDCSGENWILVHNVWVQSIQIAEGISSAIAICK